MHILTGGNPVRLRPDQPAVASLGMAGVILLDKRRQLDIRVEKLLSPEIVLEQRVDVLNHTEDNIRHNVLVRCVWHCGV